MLAQRLRRWPNIITQFSQCIWVVAFLTARGEIVIPIRRWARYGYHAHPPPHPPPPHTHTHISTKLSFFGALGYTEHEIEC